jgi:hypothetical protein
MDDGGAGNPMSRKARDMGHPRRRFAYGYTQAPSTSLGMTDLVLGGVSRGELHLNWCKNVFLAKCCQAPWGDGFSVCHCAEREYIHDYSLDTNLR